MNISLKEILNHHFNPGQAKSILLVFPFNLLSHYLRCLQLVEELKDEYEIVFADSNHYRRWVTQKGYTTFPYTDFDPEDVMELSRKFDFSWLNAENLEKMFLQQVSILKAYKPVYVLGDASVTLRMASEYCGVKYLSLLNGYMSKYYACTRRLPKIHPAYSYSQKLPSPLFDKITNLVERMVFKMVHQPFRRIRKKYHLKTVPSFLDEWEGTYTLICDIPQLFPQDSLPSHYYFIRPLFYNEPGEEPELKPTLTNGKKNILVSMGSTGDISQIKWLENEIFSEYNIIISGKNSSELKGGHIFHKAFINNMVVLPHVQLMICHGGNGTIYQALANGVPVLASTSIFEQEYNMQRIKEAGLGDWIDNTSALEENIGKIRYWIAEKDNAELAAIKDAIQKIIKQ